MDIVELGAVGELIGGIAVVATLLYLAAQVRQSTQATRAQTVTTLLSTQTHGEIALMGDDAADAVAKALDQTQTLTPAEALKVGNYLYTGMMSIQHTYEMFRLGLASDEAWRWSRAGAPAYLGFPFARIWWEESRGDFPERFADEIEHALAEADVDLIQTRHRRIVSAAGQLARETR